MTTETQDDFFANAPAEYEVPGGESRYMKLSQGDNKFRMLQKPIFGWEGWKAGDDGKDIPVRFKMDSRPTDVSPYRNGRINHFWAMAVWNFQTKSVEVLQITQKTILKPIEGFARNEDWGSPLGYSITISKEGTGKEDTTYVTTPAPHKPVPDEVLAAWTKVQAAGFNITRLFEGNDPFTPMPGEHLQSDPSVATAVAIEQEDPTEANVPDEVPKTA